RPRGHVDLGDPAPAPPAVAPVDQPLRRGDAPLRGRLRGALPDPPPRSPLLLLLAGALPEHHVAVAAVPEPAGVGRVRHLDLSHHLLALLVRGLDPRPGHAARPLAEPRRPRGVRHARHGLAGLGASLAALRDGLPAARGARDAARRLGAHGGELRLRGGDPAGLALDHLPVLLRRRCDLLGLRNGDYGRHPAAGLLPHGGLHRRAAPAEHGQDSPGHGAHRHLRLSDRDLHVLVQRERVRVVHGDQPHARAVRAALLGAHLLQRGGAAGPLVQAGTHERPPPVRRRPGGEHRHVARALHHRRDEPAPRLPALVVGHVLPDALGLGDVHRDDGPLRDALLPLHPLPSHDLDLRDAHDPPRGRGEGGRGVRRRTPIYGLLAEFEGPTELVDAARRAKHAGYRAMDAYSPFPIEELPDALGFRRTGLPLVVLTGGLVGGIGGFLMQYYAMAIAYPLNVGGRPLNSWPAF